MIDTSRKSKAALWHKVDRLVAEKGITAKEACEKLGGRYESYKNFRHRERERTQKKNAKALKVKTFVYSAPNAKKPIKAKVFQSPLVMVSGSAEQLATFYKELAR